MPRPFQFRLRAMFLLTAVVAVLCLVVLWAVKEYRYLSTPVDWNVLDEARFKLPNY